MIFRNVMCGWQGGGEGVLNNNNNELANVVAFWLAKVIALHFSFTKAAMNTGKNAKLMINLAILITKFGAIIYGNLEMSKHQTWRQ